MHDALTHLGQALPLEGIDARPESMSDSEWEDLDELARSTIYLHLEESVYSMVMYACTARDLWQTLCARYGTPESRETSRARGRSRRHRDIVCWHCGHTGHFRRRCFWRMRQRRRQRRHDALALADVGADVAYEATYDGDVMFASSVTPDFVMSFDDTLPSQLLLDAVAMFHVMPCREWFSTYASGMLGRVHLADGSAHDIVGAGDVRLSLPSGASFILRDVRHVPSLTQSLISVRQLRDSGCHVALGANCFQICQGCLVVARGVTDGDRYPLTVDHVRDGVVSMRLVQPFRHVSRRRVSFVDELQDARVEQDATTVVEHVEPVHDMSIGGHVEQVDSMDAQGESSYVMPETDALDFDASDAFEVESDLHTAVQDMSTDAEVEQDCSSETQQTWLSGLMMDYDCIGADFLVMQSFLDMLDSEHEDASSVDSQEMCEADTPSQPEMPIARDIHVDACSVQLAGSASVASAFSGLMYEMLISRPDIAALQ